MPPPVYRAPPSAAPPYTLIGLGVAAAVVVVAGFMFLRAPQPATEPDIATTEPAAATTMAADVLPPADPAAAPADPAAAPAVDTSELERLRRERDEALSAQREGQQTIANQREQLESLRRQNAPPPATSSVSSPAGVWSGTMNYSTGQHETELTFRLNADGTAARSGCAHGGCTDTTNNTGTWTISSRTVRITLGAVVLSGTLNGRSISGNFSGSVSGDFSMSAR